MYKSGLKASFFTFYGRNKLVFLSYGIVFFMLLGIIIALGIYPFGEKGIIKIDLFHSYAPTMIEMKEKLSSGGNLLYSWNGGLGTVLLHNIATMAMSPFVLLTFLFPTQNITEAILVLLLVKIPFTAVAFFIFGRYKFGANDLYMTAFSVFYAFNAYMTAYYWNTMWIDGLILLPLIAMALERLVQERKSEMYLITLSLAIFVNYLIGFFLCSFSVAYFIMLIIMNGHIKNKNELKLSVFLFTTRSLLAGGVLAFFLLPLSVGLGSTMYLREAFPSELKLNFPVLKFFASHFWGMKSTVMTWSHVAPPNIFCGILTIVLLPVYYFNKAIRRTEKILYSILLIILYLGFGVNVVDFVFNGFHFTSMMPHRFSFIYVFLLLIMAYKAFVNIGSVNIKNVMLAFIPIYIALIVLLRIVYPQSKYPKPGTMSNSMLAVNIVLLLIYACIVFVYAYKDKSRRWLSFLLLVIVIVEMGTSGYKNFLFANDMIRSDYAEKYYSDMKQVTEYLSLEQALYRAEFKHFKSMSDARIYGFKSVGTFSVGYYDVAMMLNQIGVAAVPNSIKLINPTPLVSSILGVKYLFNKDNPMPDMFSAYELKEQYGKIYLYENPYVLPLAFMVSSDILNWDINSSNNVYAVQDDYVEKATGLTEDLFELVDIETLNFEHLILTPSEGKYQHYLLEINEDVDSGNTPMITLTFKAEKDGFMNIHTRTPNATWADVWVNDFYLLSQSLSVPATSLDAGYVHAGDVIKVAIKANKKPEDDEEVFIRFGWFEVHAAQMDQPYFEKAVSKLGEQPMEVTYYDDTTVRGTVTAKEDGILFSTIPYDDGWTAYVDGRERSIFRIGTALIGVRIEEGDHSIEFKFSMKGLTQGIVISLICLAIIIFILIKPYLSKRKLKREEDDLS